MLKLFFNGPILGFLGGNMNRLFTATALGILTALPVQAATLDGIYTSYFAFGDSLTDDGKFGSLAPPSEGGRFSNGPTYAEDLATDFTAPGTAQNFAIGGATAGDVNTTPYPDGVEIGTFGGQIGFFDSIDDFLPVGDNPLISVLFGANDIFQNIFTNPDIGEQAADAVAAGISSLAALSPVYNDFLVINIPDLSLTPAFSNPAVAPLASAQTQEYNARLADNLDKLRKEGIEIVEVDQDAFLRSVLENPLALGITETEVPCTPSLSLFTPLENCAFDPATGIIDNTLADPFLFVDSVHPNRIVQAAFAQEIRSTLAPVPLPASLPFLMAGLLALGAAFRRRRPI